MQSHFTKDIKNEAILTEWFNDNFLISRTETEIVEDTNLQHEGVDFITTSYDVFKDNAPHNIDFKAALSHVKPYRDNNGKKPNKMPTFAFELTSYNRNNDEREGWLFGDKYNKTEYYLLA